MVLSIIPLEEFKDLPSLISSVARFLDKVFGRDFLVSELKKLEWEPKSRPEEYEYLREISIHRAARWYKLLNSFKERGYRFDLRFSIEVEEFMGLLLFYYSLKTLIEKGVIDLGSRVVQGKLHSGNLEQFDDFTNELFVAANYTSNDFNVAMPELSGSGEIDIYVEKDSIKVWCECKRLRRDEPYLEIAVEILRWLHEKGVNALIDIIFAKTPSEKPDAIIRVIEKYIEKSQLEKVGSLERVIVSSLPSISDAPLDIRVSTENIEYLVYAAYIGVFEGKMKIRDPKIVVFRNINKINEVIKKLERRLRDAYEQLERVEASGRGVRKVIQVDVSDAVGAIVVPYYGRDIYREKVLRKIEDFCRDWLFKHPNVDAVILMIRRIHLDPFGYPHALVVEYRTVTPYTPLGWTVETMVIPMPSNYPAEILTNTATMLKHEGFYNLALHFYRKALEINPNLKEAWNNLADLYNRLGMFGEALSCADRALEIDPSYASALVNKGIALTQLSRLDEAIHCFDKAISIDPKEKKAWYNKAVVLTTLGKYDEALKCLNKALEIDPNYKQAKNLHAYLTLTT
uniref:Tetratricopeptide repeat protein n=1 Tax=Ignisphaera aggregans TaxID=334771 RepID=A0A7J3Z4S8_9CREN